MAGDEKVLIDAAHAVRPHAHAPYSNYHVGAALVDDKGRVHVGCNVENSSYPEGTCAETNAIAAMVAQGGKTIDTIAIVGGTGEVGIAAAGGKVDACTPCGGCRQRILEFSDENTRIILLDTEGNSSRYSIEELLPASFRVTSLMR
jgi:cytidine deaminase